MVGSQNFGPSRLKGTNVAAGQGQEAEYSEHAIQDSSTQESMMVSCIKPKCD